MIFNFFNYMPEFIIISSIFLFSFIFSTIFLKKLINVSIEKKIFDEPISERKLHKIAVPNIGGVSIFFTITFCTLIFSSYYKSPDLINFLFAGIVILFLLGLKDDLVGLSSSKRFYGQLFSGFILIILGDFRIENLSLIGYSTISYPISVFISFLFFVMITNAYNLIDGVNGLLGSLTLFSCLCFSLFFYFNSNFFLLTITFSIIGATLSFLFFNFGNASIFMGSCGSYVIGSIMYFNSIVFLNQSIFSNPNISKFSMLFSILAIPLYDTLRVFTVRIFANKSPFKADANHIHHRLLRLEISHSSVVFILLVVNISIIGLNFSLSEFNDLILLIFSISILICLNYILEYKIKRKNKFNI